MSSTQFDYVTTICRYRDYGNDEALTIRFMSTSSAKTNVSKYTHVYMHNK